VEPAAPEGALAGAPEEAGEEAVAAADEAGAGVELEAEAAALDAGTGDSERIFRLLSHTGVKKPDSRSNSPTLKLFEGLEGSRSRSSVAMLFNPSRDKV
jgi:hypothetical protein